MNYLKKFKLIIRRIVGTFLRKFSSDNCVIMYIDGGFSSQLIRYSKGIWFKERGMNVKYDLLWYKYDGMDNLGLEKREWRLEECFPKLEINIATTEEVIKYRRFYGTDIHNMALKYRGKEERLKPPLYIARYDFDNIVSDFQKYAKYFDWEGIYNILNLSARNIADEIRMHKSKGKKVIGIHVRRGDMTVTGDYWKVLTPQYFETAINKVATDTSVLYFFSNGFDFVKKEIIPNIKYEYVLVNIQNKDYEDMFLYSLCNVQVSSQGSWGRITYCFNTNQDRTLVIPATNIKEDLIVHNNGTIINLMLTEEMYLRE